MGLPKPGLDAIPFTPLTAQFLDDMNENIDSLSNGTGLEDDAVTTAKIADDSVTGAKLDVTSVLPLIYPVGAIYINTTNSTNPATVLGFGTWVSFGEGQVLVGKATTGTFSTAGASIGSETHRHKGYADGDGYGNGDLRATIGAASGDAGSINYQALDPINPNTGAGLGNGTYAVNGSSAGNRAFSHYTKVVGFTSTSRNIQPSIVVYMWTRTA